MPELLFKTIKTLKFGNYILDLTKYIENPFPVPTSLIENRFGVFIILKLALILWLFK